MMMTIWTLVAVMITEVNVGDSPSLKVESGAIAAYETMEECFRIREAVYQKLVEDNKTANRQVVCIKTEVNTY